ncbi:MAG: hypothetical protein IKO00_03205 [Oscillospiraceae bacterium]|nr:hypothetical protein [Oscillospiraceae bacterium]
MREFRISLAGQTVAIRSIYDEVYHLCRDYLSDVPEAAFHVETALEDIAFERDKSLREAAMEGKPAVLYPESYLETLSVYRKIAIGMLKYDTWLMHGSAVAVDHEAFLFTAPSGTGKTTHTRLWLEQVPGAFVINGDKPLLRMRAGICEACGTPWSGKEAMNRNVIVPLRAVCFLNRGTENRIEEIPFRDAAPLLLQQSCRYSDSLMMQKTMQLVKQLGNNVRFYRLFCNMEPEAALVSWNGMKSNY